MLFQNAAGEKFAKIDQKHIGKTAKYGRNVVEFFTERLQEGCHTVNGEHPHRSLAAEFFIFSGQNRVHACPETFKTPAEGAAREKISDKRHRKKLPFCKDSFSMGRCYFFMQEEWNSEPLTHSLYFFGVLHCEKDRENAW